MPSPTRTLVVRLPTGAVRDHSPTGADRVVGDAEVRSLAGHDEEWLVDGGASLPGAERATALLARTVVQLGGEGAPSPATLRSLTVGDREALLWGVRRATSGELVDLVVDCDGCGEKLDVTLDLLEWATALAGTGAGPGAGTRTTEVDGRAVVLRPASGADHEAVAAAPGDAAARARALLRRVVASVDGAVPTDATLDALAPGLGAALAAADPAAETLVDVACPSCDTVTPTVVDAGAVLVEEAVAGARWLLEEVHVLAWHYHWAEDAILSLPTARRRRYLELVDGATGGGGP